MASISTDPKGHKTIQFVAGNGKRKTIRLGKVPQRVADEVKLRVELIAAAAMSGSSTDRETSLWLGKIEDDLHAKLSAVGLATARIRMTLGTFLDAWIERRSAAKPNSLKNYRAAIGKVKGYFGAETNLNDITPSKAEDWMTQLLNDHAKVTAGRLLKFARQFFKSAIRDKLIAENPFAGIAAPSTPDKSREFFVTREAAQSVLDACPDAEWQLIFALARFAGIRVPSEILTLRWADVNWSKARILVRAPKTEHHDNGGLRLVPIFPELLPHLEKCFDLAEPGAEFVITRYREDESNLRTQLHRIIRRAGVKPWPKLFTNLRSTRETELAAEYPIHVVCQWIGNSPKIAAKHYLQVTEADFERAAKSAAFALQNPMQHTTALTRTESAIIGEALEIQQFCEIMRVDASRDEDREYTRQESNL